MYCFLLNSSIIWCLSKLENIYPSKVPLKASKSRKQFKVSSNRFPCKKSHVSFVNVFKINVLKVIIYREGSVSKVNFSKSNELKGKVPKKQFPQNLIFFIMKNNRKQVNIKHPEFPFWMPRRNLAYPYLVYLKRLENCLFLFHLCMYTL